jgi:hypothetical protein
MFSFSFSESTNLLVLVGLWESKQAWQGSQKYTEIK